MVSFLSNLVKVCYVFSMPVIHLNLQYIPNTLNHDVDVDIDNLNVGLVSLGCSPLNFIKEKDKIAYGKYGK